MNFQDFFRELAKGKLYPLYYFYGPEAWLLDSAVAKLKERILQPSTRDFNSEAFDAGEHSAEAILMGLQVFPLLAERRMVVIRRAEATWSKGNSSFFDYLQNPNLRTCAVFIGATADLRTKFFQLFQEKGAVVAFYPPFEKELVRWIRSQAEELGHPISDEAVTLLLERIGPNLRELGVELEKLVLGLAAGKTIGEEEVAGMTADVRSENLFELPWAAADLDRERALHIYKKLLEQGEPPLLIFSLLLRHLRLILRGRELLATGLRKREIEGKLRILPRRAEEFWEQVRAFPFSPGQLWPAALDLDLRLKTTRSDKGLLFEEYLWNLLSDPDGFGRRRTGDKRKGKEG